ncbi:hypothetical protein CORC01_00987 [Colletotrichum orchidophilum]|uniref:F-box domain-containing protein n=1 Tax=Colletotrichum orchidophilum TaxID=1209926 RepID=A0A1G4BQQ8_9PEZI|nr:uncharacterized protein CORC01_00987 [Colletotrichum orchidophilum]OHF03668.1 hypothetical protein CORC01_00987 [Colletotrichum orchidophilum]
MPGMKITHLPCEVITEILSQLDNVRYLKASLLSCRLFHDAYTQRPSLAKRIIRNQIPKQLLPHAIALTDARRVVMSESTHKVFGFAHEDVDALTSHFQKFSLPQLMVMGRTYDLIVDFASDFAAKAWTTTTLRDIPSTKSSSNHLLLSPKEWLRFCRCFYRIELYYGLLTDFGFGEENKRSVHMKQSTREIEVGGKEIAFDLDDQMHASRRMLAYLAPWEIEQLGAAVEYLGQRLITAAKEVLAHDIVMGVYKADYGPCDRGDIMLQKWLCQGIQYLRKIETAPYAAKCRLLQPGIDIIPPSLLQELSIYHIENGESHHDTKLNTSLKGTNMEDIDADEGPRKSLDCIAPRTVMNPECEGFRETAYVFWDQERLEQYNLCSTISLDSPSRMSTARLQWTDMDQFDMEHSWEERSKIWTSEGRGYWSKGDYSRVVWLGLFS